jgi:bacillithiol biosynthesis cysteine-adding enzyme BshC
MASILKRQAAEFGVQTASREPLGRFERPNTLVVVAGQQPGLFGGPLYTLYKALSAISVARAVSSASGHPVVPIFWVASDDHDFEEVRRTWLSDGAGDPVPVEYPRRDGAPVSFSRIRLGLEVEGLTERIASAFPASTLRDGVVGSLREAYAPGRTWTEAFARFMAAFVAPLGALVFDPSDPEAKALATSVFEREIALLGRSSRTAMEVGSELERRGYHAQIARSGNELNFFWHEEAREPVRFDGDGTLRIGGSGRSVKPEAFAKQVRAHPEKASPGVLLRPLVQDHLLPTAAYVGGPAEVAYWGQVQALYPLFGMSVPAVSPRAGATLLEPKAAKTLEKFHLEWTSLAGDVEAVIGGALRALLPGDFPEAFQREREEWRRSLERLEKKVVGFDPSLQSAVQVSGRRMEHEAMNLERKLMQVWKRRQEESVRQIRRARAQLFPDGKLQERTLSPVGYLARYGSDLVSRLGGSLGGPGSHVLVPLGGNEA